MTGVVVDRVQSVLGLVHSEWVGDDLRHEKPDYVPICAQFK